MGKQSNMASIQLNMDEGTAVGRNCLTWLVDGILFTAIDTKKTGPQSKGSKESGKAPNMLVGTTSTFVAVGGGRLMMHFTKPMEVQDVRRERATRELEDEDEAPAPRSISKSELAALAAADPALAAVLRKAGRI